MTRISQVIVVLTLVAMIGIGVWRYSDPTLPAQIPSHWGPTGEMDGTLPKAIAVVFAPVVFILLTALLTLLPRYDTLVTEASARAMIASRMWAVAAALGLFLLGIHWFTLVTAVENTGISPRPIIIGVGLIIAVVAYLVRDLPPNSFAGFRMAQTLTNPDIWYKVNGLGAWLLVGAGLLTAVIGAFLPLIWSVSVIAVLILGATFIPLIYALRLAQG
ncbi:MAG: SdpI family protein [Phototrophicaceae bacterium]